MTENATLKVGDVVGLKSEDDFGFGPTTLMTVAAITEDQTGLDVVYFNNDGEMRRFDNLPRATVVIVTKSPDK